MTGSKQPISENDMQCIPTLARVAFAARCARLILPRFRLGWPDVPQHMFELVENCLICVERFGEGNGIGLTVNYGGASAQLARDLLPYLPNVAAVIGTIHSAAMTAYYAAYASSVVASRGQAACTASSARDATGCLPIFDAQLLHDYQSLLDATNRDNWSYATPVSPSFFTFHSEFEPDLVASARQPITQATRIDCRLIQQLRSFPDDIYALSPRQFEELVAEVFQGLGFEVTITAATRDGGRDVIAAKCAETNLRYLIECKRYAKNRPVGVVLVRALHGVVTNERGTKGIIATTSRFTKDARKFLRENEWILEGRDSNGIQDWLQAYSSDPIVLFRNKPNE